MSTTNTTTPQDFPYEDGAVIPVKWHAGFIFLAYATSFIGSYSSIRILEHGLWRSARERKNATIFSRYPRFAMSLILGFCAIWSMHFIGMQAQELEQMDDYICYNWLESLLSLVLSVIGVWAGVALAGWDVFAGSDRVDTLKYLIQNDHTVAANSRNKHVGKRHIYMVALFDLLHWIAAGSLLAALGALSMHYVGMIARRGPFRVQWNIFLIGASALFGVLICFVGFWILFRPLHWKVEKSWYRLAAAAVIALAICSLHFFGMLSATYVADTSVQSQCGGTKTWQSWRPDQFQVLLVAMAVPLVAFLVEHTISSELRFTYRRHLDIHLSGSHFLSETDQDGSALSTKRRQASKRNLQVDKDADKFQAEARDESQLSDGETGISTSKETASHEEGSEPSDSTRPKAPAEKESPPLVEVAKAILDASSKYNDGEQDRSASPPRKPLEDKEIKEALQCSFTSLFRGSFDGDSSSDSEDEDDDGMDEEQGGQVPAAA